MGPGIFLEGENWEDQDFEKGMAPRYYKTQGFQAVLSDIKSYRAGVLVLGLFFKRSGG